MRCRYRTQSISAGQRHCHQIYRMTYRIWNQVVCSLRIVKFSYSWTNFFLYFEITGETGSLHAYKCKYICTEVHANLIAQSRTIYLVAMSFGENMWGETSSIFLLITTTLVWKENISWSVSVINLLYKISPWVVITRISFSTVLVHLLIRANGYKLEKLKH